MAVDFGRCVCVTPAGTQPPPSARPPQRLQRGAPLLPATVVMNRRPWTPGGAPRTRFLLFCSGLLLFIVAVRLLLGESPPAPARVTRVLHQSWKTGAVPANFRRWRATWARCFPDWEVRLWTDRDNRRLVARHYPWFLAAYDALPLNICRADAARYLYLHRFGGLYADLDTECLRPFEALLAGRRLVFGAMAGKSLLPEGHVQNSFMYSTPRHPFWLKVVGHIREHPSAPPPGYLTGSDALMKVIKAWRLATDALRDRPTIYPPEVFNPFSWLTGRPAQCRTHGRMAPAQLEQCRRALSHAYVIQFHSHTWA